jgi:hypothetical protein
VSTVSEVRARRARLPSPALRRRSLGWPALGALMAVAFAALVYAGHDTSFYNDEWNFIQDRRGWNADALLLPHNEHLSLLPVLVYKLLFVTAGLEHYAAYRVVAVLFHLLCVALLFAYARRRIGDLLALGAAAVLLLLGAGWQDILWPFQIGFLGSLAATLGTLLALDRRDRRGDVLAAVLVGVALASSSLGIPLLIAVVVELAGRRDRARWWVVAAPTALYAVWYAAYRVGEPHAGGGGAALDNLLDTPPYVAQAAAGAAGAVFGLDPDWGRILVVAIVAGTAVVAGLRLPAGASWRLAALAALPLAFWILTGITRANLGEPTAPRYLYPGALFLLLIAIEAARGRRAAPPLLVLLGIVAAGAMITSIGQLRDGAHALRDMTTQVQGALAATEVAGPALADDFAPAPVLAPQLHVGTYRAAVRDLGRPGYGPEALPKAYQAARASADATLIRGYGIAAHAASAPRAGTAPAVEQLEGTGQASAGGCLLTRPQSPSAAVTVTVPPGGLVVEPRDGTASVQLRRWSDTPSQVPGATTVAPVAIRIPADGSDAPWHARIASSAPVRVCAGAA